MDLSKSKRLIAIFLAIFLLLAIGIYAIAYEQFRYGPVTGYAPNPDFLIGEIYDGVEVSQKIVNSADILERIEVFFGTYAKTNSGTIIVSLLDEENNLLVSKEVNNEDIAKDGFFEILLPEQIQVARGTTLTFHLKTQGCEKENAFTIYAGDAYKENTNKYFYLENEGLGTLCVRLNGYNQLVFYKIYWLIVAVVFIGLVLYIRGCWRGILKGKSNLLAMLLTIYYRYRFLLKQLVSRDFKTKYKRSALGMAWSFLNPLLTMSVQYLVFSSLFKSGTPNYPLYLLTGIVFFSFFAESVSMGMTSIAQNASLIKKVYMPKYIYPLSRTISSLVNFVFALIPLLLVILITRTPIRFAILLLVFDIICLLMFTLGMTLLLSTAMTFFQDTQFLWGIVSMMWQYMTPIFYNESIIPGKMLPVYRLNPMYQYISFARTCIIEGISPGPEAYFYCMGSGLAVLMLGLVIFKKQQDKFVLYL